MKKFNKKSLALLIVAALLLTITVSGTVAYLVDSTNALVNTFKPTYVKVTVEDQIENGVKKNVVITNSSNIDAYVRVAVVANWYDANGKIVAPWTGSIPYNSPWFHSGGFYYYPHKVSAGATISPALFDQYTPGTVPVTGAHLEMDIIVQAIQADGMGATSAQDAFSKAAQSN